MGILSARFSLLILLLVLVSAVGFTRAAGAGLKKTQHLELEIVFLKENLTSAWEVINEMRSQIERLETDDRVHHHHHHYHHHYHDNFTEEVNDTLEVGHDRAYEHYFSNQEDSVPHLSMEGDHHHHHHHIHHQHLQTEGEFQQININGAQHHCHILKNNNNNNDTNETLNNNNGNGDETHNGNGNPAGGNPNGEKHVGEDILAQATCQIRPNRALPANERQNLRGNAHFKQKGNLLVISLIVKGFPISPVPGPPANSGHHVEHSHVHGLHVHEFGDLSNGCESAGEHYNPLGEVHGGPDSPKRHIGDFGNIQCDENGQIVTTITDKIASLNGTYSILGKTLVIHENKDDLGAKPDDEGSMANGNTGRRLACCVITKKDD